MTRLCLTSLFLLAACAPKEHEGKYTHEEYWGNEIHRGHDMDIQRHDTGHDLDCISEGRLLDHCGENHGGMR